MRASFSRELVMLSEKKVISGAWSRVRRARFKQPDKTPGNCQKIKVNLVAENKGS